MYGPPVRTRYRHAPRRISWPALLVAYVVSASIPSVLWVAGRPLAGAAVVALVGLCCALARVASLVSSGDSPPVGVERPDDGSLSVTRVDSE